MNYLWIFSIIAQKFLFNSSIVKKIKIMIENIWETKIMIENIWKTKIYLNIL
jgi:hypothetical protein